MKAIQIKTKEGLKSYTPVNERLLYFLNEERFKEYRINTEILQITPDWVVMRANIETGNTVIATGHASERREGWINKTSYVENCETSAVGRALGMLGIGIETAISSAEEVALAKDAEPEQIKNIEKLLRGCSLSPELIKKVEEEITELTYTRAERCIAYLNANQRDPVESGDNYGAREINKQLDKKGA